MITCPECGQQAADDAKFCDRCGQGLTAAPTHEAVATLPPLPAGTELKGGYRIIELIAQLAHENRYRAERASDGTVERFQIIERQGPSSQFESDRENAIGPQDGVAADDDPAGPRAKTAELKRPPGFDANGHPADAPVEASPAQLAGPATTADGVHAIEIAAESAPEPVAPEANGKDAEIPPAADDLGEIFGRVMALSLTLKHPAIVRAVEGFADSGRVYIVYADEEIELLAQRLEHGKIGESEAISIAVQLCQIVGFFHRHGLRVNDLCPESIAYGRDRRLRLTSLEYVTNDNEIQAEPIFNDGYTAPEIYRARKVDKRADIFSIGAVLYTCLTGERIEAESWREEAGTVRFYPPHVVTPALEQIVRRALLFDPTARWPTTDDFKAALLKQSGQIRLRAAALTDVGMVRELNEDAVMTVEYWRDSQVQPAQGFLYVVADGMGGAEAGEIASAIAVGAIRGHVEHELGKVADGALSELAQNALEEANRQVLAYQVEHPEARGMGSTAVAALVAPPDVAVAWVGDSRAYLSEDHGLRQLSKDHSLVQRLVEIGQITEEEARHHEHKNVITRSLGARPKGPAGAEVVTVRLKRGDRLMLCSDGLTAHVEDPQIQEMLRRHRDPADAARELIVAANAGGGTDNISVVVIFTD